MLKASEHYMLTRALLVSLNFALGSEFVSINMRYQLYCNHAWYTKNKNNVLSVVKWSYTIFLGVLVIYTIVPLCLSS